MTEKTKFSKLGYYVIALMLFAMGLVFIICNNLLAALGIAIGIMLALFGAVYAVIAISSHERGVMFAVKIAFAAICFICGALTAIFHNGAVEIIAAIFSLLLIVDGSFKLNSAAECKRYFVELWWILLIPALLTIAGSFWMIKYPPENPQTINIIIGIIFIIDALGNVMTAPLQARCEKIRDSGIQFRAAATEISTDSTSGK